MSDKVIFKWRDVEQKSFDDIKRIVVHDNLLAYPYFNEQFYIESDASSLPARSGNKPICQNYWLLHPETNCFTKRYTVTEKEWLCMVETLKEIRKILLGQGLKRFISQKISPVKCLILTAHYGGE